MYDPETKLYVGDRVELTYKLLQGGTWFVAWQVSVLEDKLMEDGRFELMSYVYDEDAFTIMFEVEVRATEKKTSPKVQQAGIGAAGWVIVGEVVTLVSVLAYMLIWGDPDAKVIRALKDVMESPDLTDEQKKAIADIAKQRAESDSVVVQAAEAAGGTFAVLVVLTLAYLIFGRRSA